MSIMCYILFLFLLLLPSFFHKAFEVQFSAEWIGVVNSGGVLALVTLLLLGGFFGLKADRIKSSIFAKVTAAVGFGLCLAYVLLVAGLPIR